MPETSGSPEQQEPTQYDPATGEQLSPSIETEKSAEVTTQQGTQISHAEQTGVEWPPEAEDPADEPVHPGDTPDEE